MKQLVKVINVGIGTNSYPGDFTKKEVKIIKKYTNRLYTLHLFSGKSTIGDVRVDYSQPEATHNCDVFSFLKEFTATNKNNVECVVIDAPYNSTFAEKYQNIGRTPDQFIIFANTKKTTELWNLIVNVAPKYIILKSWNYYVPKGYLFYRGFLCYAGGYRKSTLLLILKRKNDLVSYMSDNNNSKSFKAENECAVKTFDGH